MASNWRDKPLSEMSEYEKALLVSGKGGAELYKKKQEQELDKVRAREAGAIYQGDTSPGDNWEKVASAAVQSSKFHRSKDSSKTIDTTKNVPLWQKKGSPAAAPVETKGPDPGPPPEDPYAKAYEKNATAPTTPTRPSYGGSAPSAPPGAPKFTYKNTGAGGFLETSGLDAPEKVLSYADELSAYNDGIQRDLEARAESSRVATGQFQESMAKVAPEAPETETSYDKVMENLKKARELFA
jgi:hypothetical protein